MVPQRLRRRVSGAGVRLMNVILSDSSCTILVMRHAHFVVALKRKAVATTLHFVVARRQRKGTRLAH